MRADIQHDTHRLTAEERRETVLDAAVVEFASYGLHGTSTEAIARRAGISQPYIFRLFGTKKDLFIATVERVCDRILAAFQDAIADEPADRLNAMGMSYSVMLRYRHELLVLLHGFAASEDREVQAVVRERFAGLYRYVSEVSGATPDDVRAFFAYGMLLTIATALDLPLVARQEEWARQCLGFDVDL